MTGQTSPATPGPALPPLSDRLSRVMSSIAAQARRTNLTRTADLGTALDRAAGRGLNTAGWADASGAGGPEPVRLAEARALLDQASAELADGLEL